MKRDTLLFLLITLKLFCAESQCNGSNTLCTKRYNEVAYLTTHNAYNSKQDGFKFPNQELNITKQLKAGVRALMLDVYDESGTLEVYHAYRALGSKPFSEILKEIKAFMDENEQEVVTLIFECYVTSDQIARDFEASGISKYLYTKTVDQEWKTLEQMITDNTRLVVFSDKDDAKKGQEWYHYLWSFAAETHYTNHKKSDLSSDFNRGSENASNKELFILNHFLTTSITGFGKARKSKKANDFQFLMDRIKQFQLETGKFPNFITVDFCDLGSCKEVVDLMNGFTNLRLQ